MADRETIIGAGDGGAAAMLAATLIVALVAIGSFYYFGIGHSSDATVDIKVPQAIVHVTPAGH